jgi:glycosyltransferase involved in cell wall biosynthesis
VLQKKSDMEPIISIIIPCYNHGKYIRDALQSIQELHDISYPYEVIIVNDGSTDDFTINTLNDLKKEGYNILDQNNQGLGAARNNGINLSKGKYILPLDCDNKVCAPYLSKAVDILNTNSNVTVVYSDREFFGERTGKYTVGNYNLQKLMLCNYIDACAVYRKEAWQSIGGYDTKMPAMGYEDWDMWLQFSFSMFQFYYLAETGFKYRVVNDSMIRTTTNIDVNNVYAYIENKYPSYLNRQSVNAAFTGNFKKNKKLFVKLFLVTFLPGVINYMIRKKKISNTNFI